MEVIRMFVAMFCDEQGLPRALGADPTPRKTQLAIAQLELDEYREEKKRNGDPLAYAAFRLVVKPLQP